MFVYAFYWILYFHRRIMSWIFITWSVFRAFGYRYIYVQLGMERFVWREHLERGDDNNMKQYRVRVVSFLQTVILCINRSLNEPCPLATEIARERNEETRISSPSFSSILYIWMHRDFAFISYISFVTPLFWYDFQSHDDDTTMIVDDELSRKKNLFGIDAFGWIFGEMMVMIFSLFSFGERSYSTFSKFVFSRQVQLYIFGCSFFFTQIVHWFFQLSFPKRR